MSRIEVDNEVEQGDPKEEALLDFLIRDDYRGRCPECSSENIEVEADEERHQLFWALCHRCGWQVEVPEACVVNRKAPPWW